MKKHAMACTLCKNWAFQQKSFESRSKKSKSDLQSVKNPPSPQATKPGIGPNEEIKIEDKFSEVTLERGK